MTELSEDVNSLGSLCLSLSVGEALSRCLCYSCRLISRETAVHEKSQVSATHSRVDVTPDLTPDPTSLPAQLAHLPSFVVGKALQKQSRLELRNQIQDFLLDDT